MLLLKRVLPLVSAVEMQEYFYFIFLKKVKNLHCSFEAVVVKSFNLWPFCCIYCIHGIHTGDLFVKIWIFLGERIAKKPNDKQINERTVCFSLLSFNGNTLSVS